VGLPGTNGNSEVGHESWCRTHRLSGFKDKSGCNKTLAEEQVLKDAFQYAMDNNKSTFF
jgi:2,3-bisphosphoglycerate-independent phosphoglycerate mutase